MKSVIEIQGMPCSNSHPMMLFGGMNVLESRELAFEIAEQYVAVCKKLEIPYVFKASFDKANRSSVTSFRGPGLEQGLTWLADIKAHFDVPLITDIHEPTQARAAAEVCDVIQLPAFLSRQTDLVVAAAQTGKVVNLKKGQFMSPESMQFAVQKVQDAGNPQAWITDRGTQFGYQDLIIDYRGIPTMQNYAPVVLDVTHSLQQPNQSSGVTGGRPALIETVARAGIAAGVDGLFLETHFDPKNALSDGANMLDLNLLKGLLTRLSILRSTINQL